MPYEFDFPDGGDGEADCEADQEFDVYQSIKQIFTGLDT